MSAPVGNFLLLGEHLDGTERCRFFRRENDFFAVFPSEIYLRSKRTKRPLRRFACQQNVSMMSADIYLIDGSFLTADARSWGARCA